MQSVYEGKTSGIHYTLYKLRCQQFVEKLIKEGEMNAIMFAQHYLQPLYPVYRETTDNVTCLLAYLDFNENEKTREITSQVRRDVIADQVNDMILGKEKIKKNISKITDIQRKSITKLVSTNNLGKIMAT